MDQGYTPLRRTDVEYQKIYDQLAKLTAKFFKLEDELKKTNTKLNKLVEYLETCTLTPLVKENLDKIMEKGN